MIRRPPRSTLFPTRRSSDLFDTGKAVQAWAGQLAPGGCLYLDYTMQHSAAEASAMDPAGTDRKSPRLKSSHANNSYSDFCLKKKEMQQKSIHSQDTATLSTR